MKLELKMITLIWILISILSICGGLFGLQRHEAKGVNLLHAKTMEDTEIESSFSENEYQKLNYSQAMGLQHELIKNSKFNEQKYPKKVLLEKSSSLNELNDHAVSKNDPTISVYISNEDRIEKVPIEQYVLGVALAELPGNFETEAIKAQMIAIRTYILQIKNKAEEITYDVTDTTQHQVYKNLLDVEQYAKDHPDYFEKFLSALQTTEGMVISYKGQLIEALFFSTSNGFTEDAVQVWGNDVEYLQSVESPWDELISPNFKNELTMSSEEWYTRLGIHENERKNEITITNIKRTESGRIESIMIDGHTFTGQQLREKLGLSSTDIKWDVSQDGEQITLYGYGYGHGVGLSQWGANGMAKQGKTAEQIIQHYYTNVSIEQASKLVKNL